jgi:hypothetical protein
MSSRQSSWISAARISDLAERVAAPAESRSGDLPQTLRLRRWEEEQIDK